MKEFSVRPKPQNNAAKNLTTAVGAVAILGFVTYFMMGRFKLPYRSLVGLVSLGFLVALIMLLVRYIFSSLSYDLFVSSDGEPMFVVRQITGKRERTLSRFLLADVAELSFETKKERKEYKMEQGFVKYSYTPTLSPEKTLRIKVRNRYEKAIVRIECSDELYFLLLDSVSEARKMRNEEED